MAFYKLIPPKKRPIILTEALLTAKYVMNY